MHAYIFIHNQIHCCFVLKQKECLKFLKSEKNPVVSWQIWLKRRPHQGNKRDCIENTNLRTDHSLQRFRKTSRSELENCWYAKLNPKVQEINSHFPKYCRISKSSGEGCMAGEKGNWAGFFPINVFQIIQWYKS